MNSFSFKNVYYSLPKIMQVDGNFLSAEHQNVCFLRLQSGKRRKFERDWNDKTILLLLWLERPTSGSKAIVNWRNL